MLSTEKARRRPIITNSRVPRQDITGYAGKADRRAEARTVFVAYSFSANAMISSTSPTVDWSWLAIMADVKPA
jgi:hypothetical protein